MNPYRTAALAAAACTAAISLAACTMTMNQGLSVRPVTLARTRSGQASSADLVLR